ncbi:MAG: hypothetical protein SFW35_10905 [Chitinophagales bacterium]|nr:hypothetical protein [Chitinophagales bacterium]
MSKIFYTMRLPLLLFALWATSCLYAQAPSLRIVNVPVLKVSKQPEKMLLLGQSNAGIRSNNLVNEQVLDLVRVKEADSILPRKTQNHRFLFGSIISIFGVKWRAITMERQKLVGTAKHNVGAPCEGSDRFTEYDINIDLLPHYEPYIGLMYKGYQQQMRINKKGVRGEDFTKPPYLYPTDSTLSQSRVHCEITPPKKFRPEINSKFYPVLCGTDFLNHPNFGVEKPVLGMYGAFVSDCNHSCHTELHPYEWIWWLDVNPAKDKEVNNKRWLVGLQRESSNRFKGWSERPRVGLIAVPFLFKADQAEMRIDIEHLVLSTFVEEGLEKLPELSKDATDLNFTEMKVNLGGYENKSISIHTSQALKEEGIKLWLTDVQADDQYISGYLYIAVSVTDLYMAAVTVQQ